MLKNVMISIKTTQIEEMIKDPEVIELVTEGKYVFKNKCHYLLFEESEVSGMQGTSTKIKIGKNKLELIRIGQNDSSMVFEVNKRYEDILPTPMGNIPLEILTNKLNIAFEEDPLKIHVDLEYSLSLKGLIRAKNIMEINVSQVK